MHKVDILGLFAHPDDAELCAGGTLIKETQAGRTLAIVDLTRGELGTRGTPEIRAEEAKKGAVLLGAVKRDNLGLKDGFFSQNEDSLLAVIESIRHYQPTIVITNTLYDRHPDHARAANLIREACFLSGLKKIETINKETGIAQKAHRPEKILYTIQAYDQKPDFVVDISETFDKKIAAMKAFSTQFFAGEQQEEEQTFISTEGFLKFVEGRARDLGTQVGVTFAEGFKTETLPNPTSIFDI